MARRSLDEVLSDLQQARAAFEDATAPERRAELEQALDRLRQEARRVAGDPVEQLSDDALAQRVQRCETALDALAQRRLSIGHVGSGGGMGGGGLDARQTMEHNAMVDRQAGRASLERELLALRREVRRREHEK